MDGLLLIISKLLINDRGLGLLIALRRKIYNIKFFFNLGNDPVFFGSIIYLKSPKYKIVFTKISIISEALMNGIALNWVTTLQGG